MAGVDVKGDYPIETGCVHAKAIHHPTALVCSPSHVLCAISWWLFHFRDLCLDGLEAKAALPVFVRTRGYYTAVSAVQEQLDAHRHVDRFGGGFDNRAFRYRSDVLCLQEN